MSSATDALTNDSQPVSAIKRRTSRKTPALQQAVIASALIGATNTQIAKDLDINRSTVKSILSSADIERHISQGRSDCVKMIPKSVRVIRQRLENGSETAALSILRGTQVLVNQPITANQTNIVANTWIMMRQQKQAEAQQLIDVTPDSQATSANTPQQPDPAKE